MKAAFQGTLLQREVKPDTLDLLNIFYNDDQNIQAGICTLSIRELELTVLVLEPLFWVNFDYMQGKITTKM